jgi:hypothetical protein
MGTRETDWMMIASPTKMATSCAVLAGMLLAASVQPVLAKTDVRGQPQAVELQADNASIRDVFEALAAKFNLTYKLSPSIVLSVTGVYSGPLDRVLARLLQGQNYLLKSSEDRLEIIVLGASGAPGPSSIKAAAGAANLASPVNVAAGPPVSATAPASATPPMSSPGPSLPPAKAVPPLSSYLTANGGAAGAGTVAAP